MRSNVFIAGVEVIIKEGENRTQAIKRVIKENRKKKEEENGYIISTHQTEEKKPTVVQKYSSNDSKRNAESLQEKLKERREEK